MTADNTISVEQRKWNEITHSSSCDAVGMMPFPGYLSSISTGFACLVVYCIRYQFNITEKVGTLVWTEPSPAPIDFLTCAFVIQVFVIGPDKKLKLSILYPATTGRNFDEILRVVDSLQLTAHNRVATPVDWRVRHVKSSLFVVCSCHQCVISDAHICSCSKPGDSVMVPPSIPEQEAMTLFPAGVYTKDLPSGKKYLRYTPQPNPIRSECTDG